MKIKDLENKKKKIQEELKKVDTELKNRKALCIGDYGYQKIGKGKDSYTVPYVVIKEDDDVKNFKRYGNMYDELERMKDGSFWKHEKGYKVEIEGEDKEVGRIDLKCFNGNEFVIELRWKNNSGSGSWSEDMTIDKDNLYNFILNGKYLLLRENGEE